MTTTEPTNGNKLLAETIMNEIEGCYTVGLDEDDAETIYAEILESLDSGDDNFEIDYPGGAYFQVMTDDEADTLWEDSLDSYLDDCILPELEGTLQAYFDRDAWKRDARHDGRAHCISHYDGVELEAWAQGEMRVIIRTN